jgi:hypothetical protein
MIGGLPVNGIEESVRKKSQAGGHNANWYRIVNSPYL